MVDFENVSPAHGFKTASFTERFEASINIRKKFSLEKRSARMGSVHNNLQRFYLVDTREWRASHHGGNLEVLEIVPG